MRNIGYAEVFNKRYKRFGILNPPTFVTNVSRGPAITFTRICLDCGGRTFHDIPAEDGYAVHINFLKQASLSVSTKARVAVHYFLGAGDSAMRDCDEVTTLTTHSALDTVRLYVPRLTLQDFVREEYGSRDVHLKRPQQGMRDPVLYHLGACLGALFEHPDENNSLLVDHIALSLQSHLYQAYSATPPSGRRARGGLAPWQESRAKEAMDADLDKEITIARLAHDCRLSASQFGRAFRQSTGCTPHRWRLQRRVERAQDLLLTSDKTLAQIASSCGFFDPSHLTRAFRQIVGTSPGLWRRIKRI
jgi:AraC family transcriptional regulator